jgi:hypothetical protein
LIFHTRHSIYVHRQRQLQMGRRILGLGGG